MIFDKLEEYSRSGAYPFHMPGHKRRLAPDFIRNTARLDITEVEGFDDLHRPSGIIREAEERAARLYGSEETHFLVNGSTSGLLAAIGSFSGKKSVLLARNCHRSVYNAAEINRMSPVYIYPGTENAFGVYEGVSANEVEAVLERIKSRGEEMPAAVVITSPSYPGVVCDAAGICDAAHRYRVPVIVDEAHGAHFGFSEYFPKSAVRCGADLVIQSAHKTLPALTQTALIHINGNLVDRERLRRMLTVYQTSSPSYILMGSLDACMEMLEKDRDDLFGRYTERLSKAREKLSALKNLKLLGKQDLDEKQSFDYDRSKIVLRAAGGRVSGKQLADMLRKDFGLEPEMASEKYVLLMTSIGDTDEGFDRLCDAAGKISDELEAFPEICDEPEAVPSVRDESAVSGRRCSESYAAGADRIINPEVKLPPWQAVLMESEDIPLSEAEGRTAGDYVYIYPPGVPLLVPGETVTSEAADTIREWLAAGLEPTGVRGDRTEPVIRAIV